MSAPADETPIVESVVPDAASSAAPISATERSLYLRLRQQEILAELGVAALQGASFSELLNLTARLTAEGLRAEFCKVLEYIPAENRLLVRAGVGWDEGVVGVASVGGDLDSPAGFALHTGKPVISNHLENEERFRTPELLVRYGIHRAMNVILQGDGSPFGVLEVDSRSDGKFDEKDIAFLQGAANVLGMAIECERYERHLKAAVAEQKVLLQEINHRAKNSLQLVGSMLHLQARVVDDPKLSEHLTNASNRVQAVGRLYDRLSQEARLGSVDLGRYLEAVCKDVAGSGSPCEIRFEGASEILFSSDRAVNLGLIVNELVTNACKYAYPEGAPGIVSVELRRGQDTIVLAIGASIYASLRKGFMDLI